MVDLQIIVSEIVRQFLPRAEQDNIQLMQLSFTGVIEPNLEPLVTHDLTVILEHLFGFVPESEKIQILMRKDELKGTFIEVSNTGIDLSAYTGILNECLLPVALFNGSPNTTRFEIQLVLESTDSLKKISENNFYLEIQHRLQSHFSKSENIMGRLKGSPREAAFMARVNQVIQDNLSNSQLDVNRLADLLHLSRTQLFRKLKPIIGQSTAGYIRSLRMQKAKELLETTELRVSEVAFLTGFETPSTFTRVFVKAFGLKPSVIARNKTETNGQENATG
ncbi:MAG: helix-turn-helix transcriptional regulator [Flammeovirgaceae bacterium]|nr:helix-turn-helix transcriptional regulator [Flammeovirgaceae bacterium]